jgi:hypothetical protein
MSTADEYAKTDGIPYVATSCAAIHDAMNAPKVAADCWIAKERPRNVSTMLEHVSAAVDGDTAAVQAPAAK